MRNPKRRNYKTNTKQNTATSNTWKFLNLIRASENFKISFRETQLKVLYHAQTDPLRLLQNIEITEQHS